MCNLSANLQLSIWFCTLPEMEFLEIKTRIFCSMLFTVPSTGGFKRKPFSTLVLIILTKKSAKQENSEKRVENQTKTWVWEDTSFCPEMPFKNSISVHVGGAWEPRRGGSLLEHEDRELHVSALWTGPELPPSWWVQIKSTLCVPDPDPHLFGSPWSEW